MEEIKKVKGAALHVIRENNPYSRYLLQLLPAELLQRKFDELIDDSERQEIVRAIDEIRYEKEVLSMLPINTEDTKNIEIGIKFLSNIAQFIVHY